MTMRNGLNLPAWPKPMDSLPPNGCWLRAAGTGLTATPARRRPATNSPPVFLDCATTTGPTSRQAWLAFKQLKVPAELHIYAGTGHGFGLRASDTKPAGKWVELFEEWLVDGGFLEEP